VRLALAYCLDFVAFDPAFLTEWRVEPVLLLTVLLFLLLCLYFLANDLADLSMILLFQDIRRWVQEKKIPYYKPGKEYLFIKEDLDEFIRRQKRA
jgi:hypothetical protein